MKTRKLRGVPPGTRRFAIQSASVDAVALALETLFRAEPPRAGDGALDDINIGRGGVPTTAIQVKFRPRIGRHAQIGHLPRRESSVEWRSDR
jgi:hypothetical protein